MLKPPDQAKFWRLLTDYEALTQRESVAVRHEDYGSVEEAQRLKAVILPAWEELGRALHLHRTNCPELRLRLEAISALEAANLAAVARRQDALRQQLGELAVARQRVQQVGKNYQAATSTPAAPATGFAAVG